MNDAAFAFVSHADADVDDEFGIEFFCSHLKTTDTGSTS
jgi:hypothetical protein